MCQPTSYMSAFVSQSEDGSPKGNLKKEGGPSEACRALFPGITSPNLVWNGEGSCSQASSMEELIVNTMLETPYESFMENCKEDTFLCREHGEPLTLFCLEDLEPSCNQCESSVNHEGHRLYSLLDASRDCKVGLWLVLFGRYAQHATEQAHQEESAEKQIQEEFEVLHQFLRDEEASRLSMLREESDEKKEMMLQRIEDLEIDIASLTYTIRVVEQEMRSLDVPFLQNYKDTIKRTWRIPPDPELVTGSLLDVAKHLGSLKFKVWERMKEIIQYSEHTQHIKPKVDLFTFKVPVTLDPNTSSGCFRISEDLTTLQCCSHTLRLPENPERFDLGAEVLASEELGSGKHSWDVEVRNNSYWVIGVVSASINRKGKHVLTPAEGFWTIRFRNGEYKACTAPWSPLTMSREPLVVRVVMDFNRSRVTFYDPREKTPLFTYRDVNIQSAFPYFCSACKEHPLRLLSTKISIKTEDPI
ncbi:hypothetical protein DNTS_015085 [Danionella cerebrum]|uniref:B30.2/SPRY domain-containing protein n=1 Tax=Danionella cerebrum TaxID=2873325 RepID=A0A553QQA7_9TELE|nr:hypothetical protein DNTS_015085 [Danionella translucida]